MAVVGRNKYHGKSAIVTDAVYPLTGYIGIGIEDGTDQLRVAGLRSLQEEMLNAVTAHDPLIGAIPGRNVGITA